MQWIHITQSAIYDINHTIAIIIVVVIVVKDDNGKNNGSCLVNDNKLNGRKWEEMGGNECGDTFFCWSLAGALGDTSALMQTLGSECPCVNSCVCLSRTLLKSSSLRASSSRWRRSTSAISVENVLPVSSAFLVAF